MRSRLFSRREAALLAEPTWFKSIRRLEKRPGLATPDFAARLRRASGESSDSLQADILEQTAALIERAAADGIEAAAREKIGVSGILAGEAREARERYYKSGKPADLAAALDKLVLALLEDDDPAQVGQGGPMQGLASTLMDFSELVDSPQLHHLGCLAFLCCLTANFASPQPEIHAEWGDTLGRAAHGAKLHLGHLAGVEVEEQTRAFYDSAQAALDSLEAALATGTSETAVVFEASYTVMCLVLASTRIELKPPSNPDGEPEIEAMLASWLAIVVGWIERYGSDFLRLSIATGTAAEDELGRGDQQLDEVRPDQPSGRVAPIDNPRFAAFSNDLAALAEAALGEESSGEESVHSLLMLAIAVYPIAPESAHELAARAQRRLDRGAPPLADPSSAVALLSSKPTLETLTSAVAAYVEPGATVIQRFRTVRAVLSTERLEEICSVLEPALAKTLDGEFDPEAPEVPVLANFAIVVSDLASLLTAVAVDLGLPDGERYRTARDRLSDALSGDEKNLRGELIVHPDAPDQPEILPLLARFLRDPGELEKDVEAREKICAWISAAYESGHLSFPLEQNEITLVGNLGWLYYRAAKFPEALKWLGHGRRLALAGRELTDAAIADINLAGCHTSLMQTTSWAAEGEMASGHVGLLTMGLAHTAEALRIVSTGWELTDPGDRYFLNSVGYAGVRESAQDLLHKAQDAALLAEYLLNARGMWFLLDLYDPPAGGDDAGPARPIVTWRQRAWVGHSLAVDRVLEEKRETQPLIDLAEILAPDGQPMAAWFGNLFDPDSSALSSVFLVPPKQIAASHSERVELPADAHVEEIAALLGERLPTELWRAVDRLCARGERALLFVSVDAGLPPVSMGLWRRPGEGEDQVVADAFDVVYCPSPAPRTGAAPWHLGRGSARPEAFAVCDPLGDLPQARIVPPQTRRVYGNREGGIARPANRDTVLALIDECAGADGVLVFQGHSESGALDDPEGASLLLEPVAPSAQAAERLSMGALLRAVRESSTGRMPRRAAFLSCASGHAASRHDATGIAMAALAGGADAAVSTLRPVSESAPWERVVRDLVATLAAPDPWRSFGEWQRRIAPALADAGDEEARRSLASIAIFGTPYIRADGNLKTADE